MAVNKVPVLKRCRSLGLEPSYLGYDKKSNRELKRANKKVPFSNPLNNFELERLLVSGLHLEREQMAKVLSVAKEEEKVYAALQKQLISEREKYLLLLDMINVSLSKEKLPVKEKEHIEQVRNQLKVNGKCMTLIYEFSIAANREDVTRCREILHRMHLQDMELTPLDMKYYIMRLWGTMDCTQQMLAEEKEVRIVERCQKIGRAHV